MRARRNQGSVTSDWMAIERERGISVTSTVLQFPYRDRILNLLVTPGHQDFSEDTYRTLAAVDSAVMVLDAAKGIEPQTRRLFEVCRQRSIPIFTFINKLDRPAREPLELLDEIESTLGMQPAPMNWPLGNGMSFRGVYDRRAQGIFFYERTERNERISPETFVSLAHAPWAEVLDESDIAALQTDVELLDGLGITPDRDRVRALTGILCAPVMPTVGSANMRTRCSTASSCGRVSPLSSTQISSLACARKTLTAPSCLHGWAAR